MFGELGPNKLRPIERLLFMIVFSCREHYLCAALIFGAGLRRLRFPVELHDMTKRDDAFANVT